MVDAETFQSGETVFTDLLAGLKASGVKAVFAPTSVACASLLLDQAGGLGWKVQWIAGDAWNDPAFLSEAGKAAKGVVLACAYVQGADAPFDQGFQAWLQADRPVWRPTGTAPPPPAARPWPLTATTRPWTPSRPPTPWRAPPSGTP